jgi:nucleotide-binding universal stress UspA family protein
MDSIDLHLRQDEQAYLAEAFRRTAVGREICMKTALIEGDIAPVLAEYATKNDALLVVMSTHGRGALGRFWLGSVADDLIHHCTMPVLLIRPSEGKPDLSRDHVLKNILIALDGTPLAEKIIKPTLELAGLFESTITLVNVLKPVVRPSYLPDGTSIQGISHSVLEEIHTLQKQHQDEAQAYLKGVAEKIQARGFVVQTRVVIDEQTASGILIEAQARHADLIALKTHGRRGVSRIFLGSVADKIVRTGTVPVLLKLSEA